MAIPAQCPECHKRYQAPDHMAGRRVKCKHCAVVFIIAADSLTESPDFDLADLDELSALADTGRHDAVKRGGTLAGGAVAGAAGPGAAASPPSPDDPVVIAAEPTIDTLFQGGYVESGVPRANKLYVFPMSRLMDRWLPPVLLAIGVVWACGEAWNRNTTGRPWVGLFRAGVFLLALFAAVFPFTLMGVRAAARRLTFELPPRTPLRVLGTFALPAALAAALWLIYQDVTGLLLGCATGVVVALPVLFLLLRLRPEEAPVTFAYAAGSFVLSVVVTAGALFALNLMLVGVLRSLKTEHALTVSPFGPGFPWDGPYRSRGGQYARAGIREGDTVRNDDAVPPATTQSSDDGRDATTQPDDAGGLFRPPPERRNSADDGPPAAVDQPHPAGESTPTVRPDTTNPDTPGRDTPAAQRTGDAPGHGAESEPLEVSVPGGVSYEAEPKIGSMVKSVRTVFEADHVTAVVRPAVPGPWVAVVRPGVRGTDRVERWNTDTWKAAGELQVARDPDGNAYGLSPDGELLAYVTEFPSLSVQVWSFAERRVVREIRLKNNPRDDWGEPRLLGFSRPDQLVVHWRRGSQSGLEVHSAKTPGPARQFPVEDFDSGLSTYAISPDGQSITVFWRTADAGGLATYSLATSKLLRTFPINLLDWKPQVHAAALAYTPDGTQVAAVFEGDGQALFTLWPALGKPLRPTTRHVIPGGLGAPGGDGVPGNFTGPVFDWLDGGAAYLLYGSSVFKSETGEFLGDLGIPGVRAHLAGSSTVTHVVRAGETGRVQIDAVALDLGRAGVVPGAGAPLPRRAVRAPTTRRAARGADGAARGSGR